MRNILAYNLRCKFGEEGLHALGAEEFGTDTGLRRALRSHGEAGEAPLLLFHGNRCPMVTELLRDFPTLRILHISTTAVDGTPLSGRERGFRFPVPSGTDWSGQERHVRERLLKYVEEYRNGGEPPDALLVPPGIPEHVIACYLATLANQPDVIRLEWERKFEEETAGRLSWNDRANAEKMGEFLRRAYS